MRTARQEPRGRLPHAQATSGSLCNRPGDPTRPGAGTTHPQPPRAPTLTFTPRPASPPGAAGPSTIDRPELAGEMASPAVSRATKSSSAPRPDPAPASPPRGLPSGAPASAPSRGLPTAVAEAELKRPESPAPLPAPPNPSKSSGGVCSTTLRRRWSVRWGMPEWVGGRALPAALLPALSPLLLPPSLTLLPAAHAGGSGGAPTRLLPTGTRSRVALTARPGVSTAGAPGVGVAPGLAAGPPAPRTRDDVGVPLRITKQRCDFEVGALFLQQAPRRSVQGLGGALAGQ
jgi:hypothetical protein